MYTRRLSLALALTLALGLTLALLSWLLCHTSSVRAAPDALHPDVLHVNSSGHCGEASPCYDNIQSAVDAAGPGDEIRIATGTYTSTHARVVPNYGLDSLSPIYARNTMSTTQVVVITKSVTLRGGYAVDDWETSYPLTQPTVIDAQGGGRAILIVGDDEITPTLDGLTIAGGDASEQDSSAGTHRDKGCGGGVYASFARPTIVNSVITDNVGNRDSGGYGGGIYAFRTPGGLISGTTVVSNAAAVGAMSGKGGGLYAYNTGITIRDNSFFSNTALAGGGAYMASGAGGGLYLDYYNGAVSGSTIRGNIASTIDQGAGGGVYLDCASPTLRDNVIENNTAQTTPGGMRAGVGGGVYATGGGWLLEGNQILSNTASLHNEGYGGGVYLVSSSMDLISNTIRGNVASSDTLGHGGGVSVVALPGGTTLPMERNYVMGNWASVGGAGEGGGFYFRRDDLGGSGRIEIRYNVFQANHAGVGSSQGGGLYVYNGEDALLDSNTVAHNSSATGGGLYLKFSAPVTLTNNLIVNNSAAGLGGGLWAVGGTAGSPVLGALAHNTWVGNGDTAVWADVNTTLTLTNSIVTSHTTGLVAASGGSVSAAYILFFDNDSKYSDGVSVGHETNGDPAFLDPAAGDYHLRVDSPAVNAGAALSWVSHDRDGRPRPDCLHWDLGAYEQGDQPCQKVYLPVLLR